MGTPRGRGQSYPDMAGQSGRLGSPGTVTLNHTQGGDSHSRWLGGSHHGSPEYHKGVTRGSSGGGLVVSHRSRAHRAKHCGCLRKACLRVWFVHKSVLTAEMRALAQVPLMLQREVLEGNVRVAWHSLRVPGAQQST